jgi:lysophospholipase L1-like esterase
MKGSLRSLWLLAVLGSVVVACSDGASQAGPPSTEVGGSTGAAGSAGTRGGGTSSAGGGANAGGSTAAGGAGPSTGGGGNSGSSSGSAGTPGHEAGTVGGGAGNDGAASAPQARPDAGRDAAPIEARPSDAAVIDQNTLPNVTLYLAGDSTVMDYGTASLQQGWGQQLGQYFIAKVTINNLSIGGRSIQSFMYDDAANTVQSSRWRTIQTNIQPGDYLMVQFGTNDSSGIAGRAVTPPAFEALLKTMVDTLKAKQATTILVTPSALQEWTNGREGNTRLGPYAAAMRDLAITENVLVDDLNARSVELLNVVGQTAAMQIYIGGDKAHFTQSGATQMAQIVAQELRRIGSPLAAYLK